MLQGTGRAAKQAKVLRKTMTLPEVLLWQQLKCRSIGLKFRPQHPAGDYVVDFYCHQARVIIEIDGLAHDMGDRPARDARRDAWLGSCGMRVIRIPAVDVLRDPPAVAQSILALCSAAPPPSALRGATSPDGEGSLDIS